MNTHRWRFFCVTNLLVVVIVAWGWLALPSSGNASPALTCPPVAPTQYFTFVYGSVQLNSAAAAAGTIVEARSPRGDTVGCAVVESAGLYPLMYIYGEETLGGQTTPGMRTNEAVSFYVDGIAATPSPTFNWVNSWQSTRVDLAATGNTPTPETPTPVTPTPVTPTPVTSTPETPTPETPTPEMPTPVTPTPEMLTPVAPTPETPTPITPTPVTPTSEAPVAAFTATPKQGTAPLTVVFKDASTGAVTSWVWSFGNGANSSERHPTYTYTVAGVYTVTLNVSGPHGWSSAAQPMHVAPPLPTFRNEPALTDGLMIHFTFDPPPGVTHWLWEFGDGQTSTEQNPVHTYVAAGDYTVRLTVYALGGVSASQELAVTVRAGGQASDGFSLYLPAIER